MQRILQKDGSVHIECAKCDGTGGIGIRRAEKCAGCDGKGYTVVLSKSTESPDYPAAETQVEPEIVIDHTPEPRPLVEPKSQKKNK